MYNRTASLHALSHRLPRWFSNDKLGSRQSITQQTMRQHQCKHKGRTRSNVKRTLKRGRKHYPWYTIYVGQKNSQALNIQWVMVFYEAVGKDEGTIFYSMLFNIRLLPPTPEAMHAEVKWTFLSSPSTMTYWLKSFYCNGF